MAVSRNVTVIPAIKRVGNNKTSESKPKIRVAAYCRVSTDSEEQASSYEIQIEHYTNYINANFPCFSYSNQKQEPKRPFFCRGSCNFIIISILKMQ